MDKESSPVPPKSVVISPGVVQDDTKLAIQSEHGVDNTESFKSINDFHRIRSQKPDVGLSVIGLIFFLLPFLLLFFSDDGLDIIPICCFLLLIAVVLFTINSAQITNWNKEMTKVRKQIELTEKIPYLPVNQWPQVAGLFSLIGGFIAADYDSFFLFLGGIVCLGFVLYYQMLISRRDKAFDRLVDQLK
ncbi:MAG: hypothetical protein ACO3NJ_07225 [Candidatus Poseidoniaceae archaeon]